MSNKMRGWMLVLSWFVCLVCIPEAATPALAQANSTTSESDLPAWVKDVGARRAPKSKRVFSANAYGAAGDGVKNSTKAIQKAIDACAKAGGGSVVFKPGSYLTGALFLKNNVHLRVDQGVT